VLLLIILLLNILLLLVKRHSSIGNAFFSRRLVESGDEHTQARHYRHTGSAQDILWVIAWIVAVFVFVLLLLIVGFVLVKGLPNLSFKFIFGKSGNAGITLLPALTATLMLIVLALAIALPIGVGTAIYLNEYAKAGSVIVKVIRLFIDTLSGIPSIIFGIFGYVLFVNALGLGYSLTAGSLTLAMIITPTIARSTEQSLNEVPTSMREASFSLGAGKLRTIFRVVLPRAISGIITALILSIGRIMSESAGLIFTVGTAGTFMPYGYNDGVASLAVLVWQFMSNGLQIDQAYATSAILIMVVVALNFAIFALNKVHKK
jgi:phosphate transport system permease protein